MSDTDKFKLREWIVPSVLFALLIAAAVIIHQQFVSVDMQATGIRSLMERKQESVANTAVIRDAYGVPAMFVGSKTGRDDAAFVFIRVGDEERRMRWAEWDALSAWSGARPSWAPKR